MNYIDTSVLLAYLLGEDVRPPSAFFEQPAVGSRLLEIEASVRLRRLGRPDLIADAEQLMRRVTLLEIGEPIVQRAKAVRDARALDAIHLATAAHLHALGIPVTVCSYDKQLMAAAAREGMSVSAP